MADGALSLESRTWICSILRQLPLLVSQEDLRRCVGESRDWYVAQLVETQHLDAAAAAQKADSTFASLFAGWRDPVLRRTTPDGRVVTEPGVPLRAMTAYLFGEAAKNFHMIHHREEWIACVTRSQQGDRCVDIDPDRLPDRAAMEMDLDWERGAAGPERLDLWLERCGATPFDFNRGLDDASLDPGNPPEFHCLEGSSFFRGLALIDLAEAMLKRVFGRDSVAVRVNAAGQGDYFQVHIDTTRADPQDVKEFIRAAFYRRFGIVPDPEFVETHPGGGAAGIRLARYDALPQLIRRLQMATAEGKTS